MRNLNSRYAPLIASLLQIYADDKALAAQLRKLIVTEELWDDGLGGGHLQFNVAENVPPLEEESVHAWCLDSDRTPIEIILHPVSGRLSWGEWVKSTGTPIIEWPPICITADPPKYTPDGRLLDWHPKKQ